MNRFVVRAALTGIVAVIVAATSTSHGAAQGRRSQLGGPRDWSHGRVIASDFGPDMGRKIGRDWRTYAKHARLQHARAMQDLQDRTPFDWVDLLKRALDQKKDSRSQAHLDWNLRTGGFGNVVGAPAKYSFDITSANCSDVIYFTVDQNGSATSPNVIAITNPYATCPGNATGATPTVKWGIQMTNGTATSAVPSLDGTVLYVLENRAAGVRLHAIKVDNITTNPGTYNFGTQAWSNAHVLTAPTGAPSSEQLFEITFAGVVNNVASPYLDYSGNQIFFGDSTGRIQHVINTHLTTASRDAVNFTNACGAAQLQSPVFVSNQVIVTSYNGFLYRLNTAGASPYACIASTQAGAGTGAGIAGALSAPIVDVTNSKIIVSSNNAAGFGVAGVGTVDLMFAAGASPAAGGVSIGPATTTAPVIGTLDDAFWSTNNGNFYIVAANAASNNTYLVRLPYNGALGGVSGYAQLHRSGAGAVVNASPVTEFLTASALANKDFVFVGGGGGSYLFMNRIGAGFAGTDAAPVNMANWFAAPGGVISQIIVDTNTSAVTGATATANIYYGTIGIPATTQSTIVQLAQQF